VRDPLRVGVVGCGGIAQMMHLPTLAERPDLFSIVAVADVDPKTLREVAQRYQVGFATRQTAELLARPGLEAVLLLASGSHERVTLQALAADKHVFVEKPVGFSLAEAENVARASRGSRRVLMVGYHKRFDPHYRRARDVVRGLRGLRFVEVTVLHPDDGAYRTHHAILPARRWSQRPEAKLDAAIRREATTSPIAAALERSAGRGSSPAVRVATSMLFQSLIHDINALRGMLGEPEQVISAHLWRAGMAQTSLTRFRGELRVSMSWVSLPGLKHYEESLLFASPDTRLKLVFPSPYLRHLPTSLTIERREGQELVVERRTVSYEEAFRAELHHFRDCVRRGRRPETGIEDALGDARWIQAIARRLTESEPARPRRRG